MPKDKEKLLELVSNMTQMLKVIFIDYKFQGMSSEMSKIPLF